MMTANDLALEALHTTATDLFREALENCNIQTAFDRRIRFEGTKLHRLMAEGDTPAVLDLKDYRRIHVIAIGKAAPAMLETLLTRMARRKGLRGICCSGQVPE